MSKKKNALTIAGFDPSGGAGVLSDVKTLEAHHVNGLAVCTAITAQNEHEFQSVFWVEERQIIAQMKSLLTCYQVGWVKIGLIKNTKVLSAIINELYTNNPNIRIIWDPILTASAGFVFHEDIKQHEVEKIYKRIYLITPNLEEMKILFPNWNKMNYKTKSSYYCAILVKGGHGSSKLAKDILYLNEASKSFEEIRADSSKHGTGCVLSSAIAANLAIGMNLEQACYNGKKYITEFIKSNPSRLGYHNYEGIKTYC